MKLNIVVDHYFHLGDLSLLHQLLQQGEQIMSTQAELAAAISAVKDQLVKATAEITAAIAAAGNTTPEVDAAVAGLQAVSQALDDLNPDATT